jgi:hypothetical protein
VVQAGTPEAVWLTLSQGNTAKPSKGPLPLIFISPYSSAILVFPTKSAPDKSRGMMDYNNYSGHQSQPYSLYGLPTPDQQPQAHSDDALRDPFSLVRRLHLPGI